VEKRYVLCARNCARERLYTTRRYSPATKEAKENPL